MDKYDEAIAWLREQDGNQGSYFEEVACLMEELLGRIHELESANLPDPPKTEWEIENDRRMKLVGKQLAERSARYHAKKG